MNISDDTQLPANFPGTLSSNSPPDRKLHLIDGPNLHRRKTGKGVYSGAVARQIMYESPGNRVSGPHTPFLRWKFKQRDFYDAPAAGRRGFRPARSEAVVSVSARKLGAALWQLTAEVTATTPGDRKPDNGHLRITFPIYQCCSDYGTETKPWSPNHLSHKHKSSLPLPRFAMEGATEWDPQFLKSSTEVRRVFGHMKFLKNGLLDSVSILTPLQAELARSRAHIQKLEAEQQSFKKKIKHFLRKLGEEQTSWLTRERQKVHVVFDDLKHELNRERINCQRVKAAKSKLLNDLADAKMSAKLFMQDYEKERKTRKLMEEVCHDLAKKVEEDKTKVEALKRRSMRIHEEVEEERKPLQIAEVWREERLQMKLVNAKLVLEEKYQQMNNIIADLETFLISRDVTEDMTEMSKTEAIRRAVNSVDVQDQKKFSFMPMKSNDMYLATEDIYEVRERATSSRKSLVKKHSNGCVIDSNDLGNTSGLETATHAEDQVSSCSPQGNDYSVNRCRGIHISTDDGKHDQDVGEESFNSGITEICSASVKQPNNRASSIRNLWRPCPSDGHVHKTMSVERKEKLKIQSTSNLGTSSPDGRSVEDGLAGNDFMGQLSSQDLGNPHITRGIKGCIEWPRGIQRHGLKARGIKGKKSEIPITNALNQRS